MTTSTIVEAHSSPGGVTFRNWFPFSFVWFSVAALAISVLASHRMAEGDIWVHLRNAKELATHHHLIRADFYTFTSAGAPLINFEWLSELAYYYAFQFWGLRGLLAAFLVLVWLTFGGVYYLALRRGANCADAALVTMAGALLGSYSFGPRMFHFGWLCLVTIWLVLDRFERTGKGLWALPVTFVLWINLHASWVFGFVLFAIYIGCGLLECHWINVVATKWSPRQLSKLLIALAASVAALFINPYGYKLVLYPFELLSGQKAVRDDLTEWQSVDFHTFWGKLALCMVLLLLTAVWFSPKPWPLREVLLAAFAVWTSFLHVRFLLFAGIVLVPVLAQRLQVLGSPHVATKKRPWLNFGVTAAIIALIVWTYPTEAHLQDIIDSTFPTSALRFMQAKRITGRLFHYYAYGGYIEWCAPEIKTFADPRTDLFVYNGVLADYLKINALDHPLALFDKYGIDYVLFPADRDLMYLLDHNTSWQLIYSDKVAKLFERVPTARTTSQLGGEVITKP